MRIFMDLGGPKVRTGAVAALRHDKHAGRDELVAVVAPGELRRVEQEGRRFRGRVQPAGGDRRLAARRPPVDRRRQAGGEDRARRARASSSPGSSSARLKATSSNPEKGLNFPDAELAIPALTAKDREDLRFVAAHADAIDFSFVQSVDDIESLQDGAGGRPARRLGRHIPLVLKIETPRAVRHLPELIVRAAARQPTAVMIARGDLAIEMGFTRLAEMQEEILWIAEAARSPGDLGDPGDGEPGQDRQPFRAAK